MTTQTLATGDPLRLGPYRLLGVLGEGGMGKVYIGRDADGVPAAVKVLRPELAHDQHLAQRFVREADMARAVTSKGVARVLGAQTEGGRPWIAAEFLAGPTLDEAVRAYGPLDVPAVRTLAAQLARTLHDIHAAGLIHRDLKPANIVLTSTGPRIIDFGIARPEHGLTLTTTGQIPVTPGYGAPEQVLGQRVGPASDVFSLGAVLAYAASGRRTFDGAHVAAVQYEVVHGTPDLSLVPPELQELIGPCLAKDPAHRPQPPRIVEAFAPPKGADRAWRKGPLAEDIKRREAATKRLTAPADTAVTSASPSRRRFLTGAAVTAAVLGAGGGAGAWWLSRGEGKSPTADVPPAVPTPEAAFISAIDTEPGTSPDALWGPFDVVAPEGELPLPVRDVVVVQAKTGGLLALSVTSGKERWRARDIDADAGFVSVADRLVVAVDKKGVLNAFVASTGAPVWQTGENVDDVLAADDTHVYLATKDNQLHAVNAWTLATTWSRPMHSPRSHNGPAKAAVGRQRLVVHGRDGRVAGLFTENGETDWQVTNQGTDGQAPAIGGNTVYLGGHTLTARRLDRGDFLWKDETLRDASYPGYGTPAADGELVVAVDTYTVSRLGTIPDINSPESKWSKVLDGYGEGSVNPPVVEGATVWVHSPDSKSVEVIHKVSGESLFTVTMLRTGSYQLASDGNRVFIARGGRIGALPVFGV
ncbi:MULTISPECIES: serine/threonine-protein kinase [unclassified Streptomyces]|uniref:serine/threonine-protein kinase n=1 Tax=unclassified Streptomyces TaxID=2593676 RepID=UPI0006F3B81F|nr:MULTISPECIES: serine/threonine-protein kinase [unclassified Streptomyces]KQX52702.1 serine/threonine protein kinase [Streptomyces sp. Root1304]KRA89617.1 serine/threonine protein kinase [Streptomyces sp. Root66D1]